MTPIHIGGSDINHLTVCDPATQTISGIRQLTDHDDNTRIYPVTRSQAVYVNDDTTLPIVLNSKQEAVPNTRVDTPVNHDILLAGNTKINYADLAAAIVKAYKEQLAGSNQTIQQAINQLYDRQFIASVHNTTLQLYDRQSIISVHNTTLILP